MSAPKVPDVLLPRALWPSVGITESGGVPTHALGDQHARDVITGRISYETALRQEQIAKRHLDSMRHVTRTRR